MPAGALGMVMFNVPTDWFVSFMIWPLLSERVQDRLIWTTSSPTLRVEVHSNELVS